MAKGYVSVPTNSGFSLASSNAAIKNFQDRQAQIALDEQRQRTHDLNVQTQAYLEGTPERERQAKIALNQALLGASNTARENAANQFVLRPETVNKLMATEAFQKATKQLNTEELARLATVQGQNPNMTQEEFARNIAQGEYLQQKIAEARANPAKFTDPKLYEQLYREQYANTSASQENIDKMVQRQMQTDYDIMDKDISKTLLTQNTVPTLTGASKLLSGSGAGSGGSSKVNDKNLMDQVNFINEQKAAMGIESGDGGFFRGITDWGDHDINEQDLEMFLGYSSGIGAGEAEAIVALRSVMNEDTIPANMADIIKSDPTGKSTASKAHAKILSRINSLKANENRGGGGLLGPAAQAQLMSTYSDQVNRHATNQQNILAGMKPRQMTNQQREEWLLGNYAAKPAATVPPPENTGQSDTQTTESNKPQKDAGAVIDDVIAQSVLGDKESYDAARITPDTTVTDSIINLLGQSGGAVRARKEKETATYGKLLSDMTGQQQMQIAINEERQKMDRQEQIALQRDLRNIDDDISNSVDVDEIEDLKKEKKRIIKRLKAMSK